MKIEMTVLRTNVLKTIAIVFAPHFGCIIGQVWFAVSTNSIGTFSSAQAADWPNLLRDFFNPTMAFYTAEFATKSFNAPAVGITLCILIIAVAICVTLKKWIWLAAALLLTFSCLEYFSLRAWKV